MKKNKFYLREDQLDLINFIKVLYGEKILIFFISIIFGLAGYLYASFLPQKLKTEITIKNPPIQLFERYNFLIPNNNQNNLIPNNNQNNITAQFNFDFELNFLSQDNLKSFIEENSELNNFKEYLKLNNISIKEYFAKDKFGKAKQKNINMPNKYF
jgi:LPS O-antigen subunit length determinant protein (WzzB/FepE family)